MKFKIYEVFSVPLSRPHEGKSILAPSQYVLYSPAYSLPQCKESAQK